MRYFKLAFVYVAKKKGWAKQRLLVMKTMYGLIRLTNNQVHHNVTHANNNGNARRHSCASSIASNECLQSKLAMQKAEGNIEYEFHSERVILGIGICERKLHPPQVLSMVPTRR